MKRFFKIVFWLALVLVLLVAGLVVALPSLLDSQELKAKVVDEVRTATGRELLMRDDIQLSLFPWLGVKLGVVALGNAKGFGDTPFARSESINVRVRVWPLFSGKVEMDTVTATGLALNLARNADGTTNWADLAGTKGAAKPSSGSSDVPVGLLAVGGLDVRDSALSWRDDQAGQTVNVKLAQLTSGPVAMGKPVDLSMEFDVDTNSPPMSAHVKLSGTLALDMQTQRLSGRGMDVSVTAKGEGLPPAGASARVKANIDMSLDGKDIVFDDLTGELPKTVLGGIEAVLKLSAAGRFDGENQRVELSRFGADGSIAGGPLADSPIAFDVSTAMSADLKSGALSFTGLRGAVPDFSHKGLKGNLNLTGDVGGNLNTQKFSLAGIELSGTLSGNGLPAAGAPVKVGGSVDLDLAADTAEIKDLALSALDLKAQLGGKLSALRSNPSFQGRVDVAPFDARALAKTLAIALPPMADAKSLSELAFKADVQASPVLLSLAKMALKLDGASVSGDARVPLDGKGSLRADLTIDNLDADRYLPPKSQTAPAPAPAPAGAGVAALQLPLETLRALDVDMRLRAKRLKVSGIAMADVDVGVSGKDGQLAAKPLSAKLMGGSYAGDIRLDASGDQPVIQINEAVRGMNFGDLLVALGQTPGALKGASGNVDVAGQVRFDPKINEYKLTGLKLDTNLKGEALPGGQIGLDAAGSVLVNLSKQTLGTDKLAIKFNGIPITATLAISRLLEEPGVRGRIDIGSFNPRLALTRFGVPLETSDPKALTKAAGGFDIAAGANSIALENLQLGVDDTNLRGGASVANFAKPQIRFDLNVDGVDADRYLPPQAKGKPAATPGGAAAAGAGQLPMDLLRSLDIDGSVQVGVLRMSGLKISAFKLQVKGKDGVIRANPVSARLYQGEYSGDIGLDATGNVPKLSVNERLTGIQAEPLLKDLVGEAKLAGRGQVTAKLTGVGATPADFKKSLQGTATFDFRDGAYKGVNIARMIRSAKARLRGQAAPPDNEQLQTDFSELTGSVEFKDGIALNRDLRAFAPYFRFQGEGAANLLSEQLDYRLSAIVVNTSQGQGGKDLTELEGLELPVKFFGPFDRVDYALDQERLIAALGRREINKRAEKIGEKLKDKLGEKGGGAVQNLLKGILN